MSASPGTFLDSIPLPLFRRVVAVCDRYESAWREGSPPLIEAFLADAPQTERPYVLLKLLELDLELRGRSGQQPHSDEYYRRFADDRAIVDAAFASHADAFRAASSVDPESTRPAEETPPLPSVVLPDVPGYAVIREIGRGAMGRVFAATDLKFGREVAVKALLPGRDFAEAAERFVREARITGRLAHPNIPPAHELGTLSDDRPFLAMKLVRGHTLADLLAGRVDPQRDLLRFVGVFELVCQAVGFAHARGVIHRDLKPANVMVGEFGEVQVMDWGLALERGEETRSSERHEPTEIGLCPPLTHTGALLGTPAYMAPEQARREAADARADVFALGAILCEVLTGTRPFRGASAKEIIEQAVAGDLTAAFARIDARCAPPELTRLAKWCLSPCADDRPADGSVVAAEVAAYRAGVEERLREAEREQAAAEARAVEGRKRKTFQILLAAAVGGAIVLGVLWRATDAARGEAVTAQQGEAQARERVEAARDESERARDNEMKARAAAETTRDELKQARDALARIEYGRTVRLAYQAWLDNDLPAARRLLDTTHSELRGWEWRYVHRLCHAELITLRPHTSNGSINSFRFSPDGTRVLTTDSADREPQIRDARTGAVLLTLRGHTGDIRTAVFSADGKTILTSAEDGTVRLWDAKTGSENSAIRIAAGTSRAAGFTSNGLIISQQVLSIDQSVTRFWDAATGTEVTLKGARTNLRALGPDGGKALVVRADLTVLVVDARTGTEVAVLRGLKAAPNFAAQFSPDGARVVTTNLDKAARIWDAATGAEVAVLDDHTAAFVGATFSPDGKRVLTCSGTTARVWDGKTGGNVVELKGHTSHVSWGAFDPTGERVGTASYDETARIWDAKSGTELLVVKEINSSATGTNRFEFSSDGGRLMARRGTGGVSIWDTRARVEDRLLAEDEFLPRDQYRVGTAGFSPDGVRAIFAAQDGRTRIRDIRTGGEIATLAGSIPGLHWATFSPDGSRLLTMASGSTLRLWNSQTGAEVTTFRSNGLKVGPSAGRTYGPRAAFSPYGERVAIADGTTTVSILDARTGAVMSTLKGHTGSVASVAFGADGKQVVTASSDGTVRVWDPTSGGEVRTFTAPTGRVGEFSGQTPAAMSFHEQTLRQRQQHASQFWSAVFSPDGQRVVSAGGDGTARVWDVRTGTEVLALTGGHRGAVRRVVFSPDGERIATASVEAARVWDARSGTEYLALKGSHDAAALGIAFAPDGETLAISSARGVVRVWDARPVNADFVPGRVTPSAGK